jgi:hypothetical protein
MKKAVSITLDNGIVEDIKKLADYEGRSFSQCVNYILKLYLEKNKENKN